MAQMISAKRLQIDKANATVTIVVALASFLTISSIMMTRSLLIRRAYQARVIAQKDMAADQLEANIKAVERLEESYAAFIDQEPNVIGGTKNIQEGPNVNNERNGDNAKITLDALPSKYDFPAVTTSLEKLLVQRNFKINSIAGTDKELEQKEASNDSPTPIEMPFNFVVASSYDPITDLLKVLEKSIRPMQVQQLTIKAKDNTVELDLNAKTYYLPEKTLSISKKAVK